MTIEPKKQNLLIDNLKLLTSEASLTLPELAKLTKVPRATVYNLFSETHEPRLSTLQELAKFFGVNISQLIGELPLSYSELAIPILQWSDINIETGKIEFSISPKTKFISTDKRNNNQLFALIIESDSYLRYKKGDIIIIEITDNLSNHDIVLVSQNKTKPILKKAIVEGKEIYLESISSTIPLKLFDHTDHIFGVVRETRIMG